MGYNVPSEYTNAPDLRGRTIQRIMTEGLFHMAYWEPAGKCEAKYRHGCLTASCLARNIVLAAKDLGLPDMSKPWYSTAQSARVRWADLYGDDEAARLSEGFYGDFSKLPLNRITPQETVAFIYRCALE